MNENTDKKGQSVLLGNILSERTEKPSLEDIYSGKIRIISKIRFDTGQIELRNNSNTKTGMILIFPGDLVLSGINACKGAIAVYDEDNTEAIAATIHYSSYKPYKNKVDIKFLWLLLRSEVFRDILNQYLPGGIKTELKAKKFLKIPIPLPPLSEQQRIVSKLTVLSSKIEEAKKLNEKALIETDSIIDSTLDRIIKNGGKNGWNFVPFDNVCEINPSKRGINYADDLLVSFIPMTAVDDHTGTIINHIIKPYYEVKNGYKWFVEGDVIFARITPCMENGKSAIARNLKNGVGFGSTEFHVLRPKENVLPEWIHYFIRSKRFRKLAEESFKGTAGQQRVQESFFYKQKILLPPKDVQQDFVKYLDNLQERITNLKTEQLEIHSELNALVPSILSKAFKGEL